MNDRPGLHDPDSYVLETFPAGRVFHVLSIVSPDDPLPTLGSA